MLRNRLQALIVSHERAGSILDQPVIEEFAPELGSGSSESHAEDATASFAPFDRPWIPIDVLEKGDDAEIDLGFLLPSQKPDILGRLDQYEVIEVLGQGGFGIVLKAFDERLQRIVAIKALKPNLAVTSPPRKRFLREARSTAAVRHENVVAIHAVEDAPIPYLVMDFIAGRSLQQKLDETGPLELLAVLEIGRQIASGLAASHATGLIHRDIKPANIMLEDGSGHVKITDFGLARTADDASLTESSFIIGTPLYMAPEQALCRTIDHRTDLFSLGSVLYALCTGRPPFRARGTFNVLKRLTEDTPRPIREIIPETPEWFCAIIAKLHAKDPDDRYVTAIEVADLLKRCLLDLKEHGAVQATTLPPSRSGRGLSWKKRRLVWGFAGLLCLCLVGASLSLLAIRHVPLRIDQTPAPKNASAVDHPKGSRQERLVTESAPSEYRLPGDSYDLLAMIPPTGNWRKKGEGLLQAPVMENAVIQVPVAVSGAYRLTSAFTRRGGEQSVNYYFPVGDHVGILYLDIGGVNSLVIDGEFGPDSPVKSPLMPLVTGKRYQIEIKIALHDDDATIEVELNHQPHLQWTGLRSKACRQHILGPVCPGQPRRRYRFSRATPSAARRPIESTVAISNRLGSDRDVAMLRPDPDLAIEAPSARGSGPPRLRRARAAARPACKCRRRPRHGAAVGMQVFCLRGDFQKPTQTNCAIRLSFSHCHAVSPVIVLKASPDPK